MTLTASDGVTPAVVSTTTLTVSDAALGASGLALSSINPFSGTVAASVDANPFGTVSDFTAVIDWGDGASTTGAVSASTTGFSVSGSHTYAALGPFVIGDKTSGSGTMVTGSVIG